MLETICILVWDFKLLKDSSHFCGVTDSFMFCNQWWLVWDRSLSFEQAISVTCEVHVLSTAARNPIVTPVSTPVIVALLLSSLKTSNYLYWQQIFVFFRKDPNRTNFQTALFFGNTCKPGIYFKIQGKAHSETGNSRKTMGRNPVVCNIVALCVSLTNVATRATPDATLTSNFQLTIITICPKSMDFSQVQILLYPCNSNWRFLKYNTIRFVLFSIDSYTFLMIFYYNKMNLSDIFSLKLTIWK